jgi:uncharacterized protein YjbI with pentapeptide repeats
MKAHEVLKRYADGRRDFRGENLTGQSFKGKDLSGANFSEADIRGANFTNAILRGTNFKEATAGLKRHWAISLVTLSLLLSGISGVVSTFAGGYFGFLLASRNFVDFTSGVILLVGFVVLFIVTVRQGLAAALVALATLLVLALAGGVSVAGRGTGSGAGYFAFAMTGTVAGAMTGAVAGCMTGAVAGAVAFASTLPVTLVGAVAFAGFGKGAVVEVRSFAFAFACAVAGLSAYIGWHALVGENKHTWVRGIAIAFAAIGGTSFRNADLTNADFRSATIKSTDFRRATLTRTHWHQAKKLDRVRPGTTYLQTAQVRQLLITGQGQAQNFDRQPLRGVNLQGAKLADASFIGADLSEANLQDADLSRTKLVQAQLDHTDLTGATLTGAYIEDWGITPETKLNGVRCDYVFMRLPPPDSPEPNPRRKPDDWNKTFKDGEFSDFIAPMVQTLDLYHNRVDDPRLVAIAFQQLRENHPEAELEIVSIEKRGKDKDKVLIRAETSTQVNHSELHAEYFTTYDELQALPSAALHRLLAEKDGQIRMLAGMVETAINRPGINANTYLNQGDTMSESKGNINITSGDGSKISGIAGAGESVTGSAMADISGTVTTTINELPDSSEPDKPGIKELLSQLQAAINDPNLADDDKEQVLEQIKVLAEAGQNPKNETAQKQAKRAMGFLKVIAEGLPSAAQLVKTCQDILPAIAHYFGLG